MAGDSGLVFSFSVVNTSFSGSLGPNGVVGLFFSGDCGVERPESLEPSIIKLRSLTLVGCSDCIRLCGLGRGTRARSVGPATSTVMRLTSVGTRAASLTLSFIAAWAFWMANEVPMREGLTLTPGDCGFNGSGGGARSGSELSHL